MRRESWVTLIGFCMMALVLIAAFNSLAQDTTAPGPIVPPPVEVWQDSERTWAYQAANGNYYGIMLREAIVVSEADELTIKLGVPHIEITIGFADGVPDGKEVQRVFDRLRTEVFHDDND